LEKAKADLLTTGKAFRELSDRLEPTWLADWTRAERKAMDKRGKALEIYDVALDEGMDPILFEIYCTNGSTVATLADIRLQLTERETQTRDLSGTVSTLTEGLAIERSQ
jgi:hypothetical protein